MIRNRNHKNKENQKQFMSVFRSVLHPSDDVPTFSRQNRESGIGLTFIAVGDINGVSIDDEAVDGADLNENTTTTAGNDDRFAVSTEGLLGFETENGQSIGGECNLEDMASPPPIVNEESGSGTAVVPVVIIEKARARIFPPLLSTLNRNGRPRFNLEMVREAGRLQIVPVPNYRPEVIRTALGDDRVRITFISCGDRGGDVEKKKK